MSIPPFSLQRAVRRWLRALTPTEKALLKEYHLEALLGLQQINIDYNFLHATLSFWDSDHHVFVFRGTEICPLPDEFAAILGYPTNATPATPGTIEEGKTTIGAFLGLDANTLAEIVVGDEVNLEKLVKHHFRPSKNMTEQKLNIRALVFCLLNHYLLSNNNGEFGDIRLIPLISQMESCYSIIPLVVAETLLSADELKKDAKSEYLKGIPLLLHIWLMERLRLLETPADPKHYRPIALGNRKYLHRGQDEAEWASFFTHGICSIKWVVPWWGLTTMTGGSDVSVYVSLLGLSRPIYIFPYRVMRQYGLRQTIPFSDTVPPKVAAFSQARVQAWAKYYDGLPRWAVATNGFVGLSENYKLWMSSDDKAVRTEARNGEPAELLIPRIRVRYEGRDSANPRTHGIKTVKARPDRKRKEVPPRSSSRPKKLPNMKGPAVAKRNASSRGDRRRNNVWVRKAQPPVETVTNSVDVDNPSPIIVCALEAERAVIENVSEALESLEVSVQEPVLMEIDMGAAQKTVGVDPANIALYKTLFDDPEELE
ncbi:uncharacterized protein [Spinacia oleracea]|uniref:DUF7745 domain-containing protein n=1 Tax=Spinacia oleracea TaxID=3562 RepID=A0ABM3QUJ1_SPIOL|nr:uncharacterized protein LOC130462561 [Spinacia oleracea]